MTAENADGWIPTTRSVPCFVCFGFQTGKKIRFRLDDGTEHEDIYQGWGIFGTGHGFKGVTHWKPVGTTATHDDVHAHDGPDAHASTERPE